MTEIKHYGPCDQAAVFCAVDNIRDYASDPAYADEAARLDAMTAVALLDYVMMTARDYQNTGLMGCSCKAMRLKAAEEELRIARKQYRAGLVSPGVVDGAKAERDALKAAS
jgi:hypothetical protein